MQGTVPWACHVLAGQLPEELRSTQDLDEYEKTEFE